MNNINADVDRILGRTIAIFLKTLLVISALSTMGLMAYLNVVKDGKLVFIHPCSYSQKTVTVLVLEKSGRTCGTNTFLPFQVNLGVVCW